MNSHADYVPAYDFESSNNGASSSSPNNFDFSGNEDHTKTWKKPCKRVEQRLVTVLEKAGDICDERHELVSKIRHGDHEETFHKIGRKLRKKKPMKKSESMKRRSKMSRSEKGIKQEISEADELRPQRFKITTPDVIEEPECDSQGDQTS